jgi:hypothetical protein
MAAAAAWVASNAAMFQAIGTAVSVVGALSQGQQAKSAADYNAAVANNNAIAARQQADANAAAQQRKARLQIGSMRAGYGASGVSLEGSPLDVLEQSASMAELDRQNILYGGALKAQGYEATAGLELMRGDAAVTGSYFNAGSALLMGAAKTGAFMGSDAGVTEASVRGNNPDEWNDWEMRRTG